MFDWFWRFLYSISEILFEIVDGILSISNRLCGIEPIEIAGNEVNFIDSLMQNDTVMHAFGGMALISIFLLMIFSTIAICRNMKDGKKTNGQIAVQVFKTVGLFMIVPALMFGFSSLLNIIVQLMYKATRAGDESLGQFLFESFRPAGMRNVQAYVDWRDAGSVEAYLGRAGYSLSDYRFFFSWIITIPLIFCIAKALFLFVDRTLSIILLFIMSPVSLSTAVLDDGARFKFWRDKVITKFISGYGMIIAINIYVLVLSFITRSDVIFIPGDNIVAYMADFLLKCAFAIGGAYFLPRTFGLVGDLFTNGASSGEMRATADTWREMKQDYNQYKAEQRHKKQDEERKKEKEKRQNQRVNSAMGGSGRGSIGGGLGYRGSSNNGFFKKLAESDIGKKVANAIIGTAGAAVALGTGGVINPVKGDKDETDKTTTPIIGEGDETGNGNQGAPIPGGEIVKNVISGIIGGKKDK